MEQSVLKYITTNNCAFYYEGWRNGKKGGFVQSEGVYYFCEMYPDAFHERVHTNLTDNPIVAVGVVSTWLQLRRDTDPFIKRITKYINNYIPEDIKEMFTSCIQREFKFFKEQHRDDPDTLDWDWDYEFYAKYIIPRSIELNTMSEALFDYISDSDIVLIRKVMNAYIKYLKDCRSAKGYQISPQLLVLRGIHSHNYYVFEDLEDDVINSIGDKLEAEGYIYRAWDESHQTYDKVSLLDKGLAYMKQLEAGKIQTEDSQQQIKEQTDEQSVTGDTGTTEWNSCFDDFLLPNFNPQAIAETLQNINHPNLPKVQRGYWWVFITVLTEINWLAKKNHKLVLKWANLHFKCGWDWTKDNQFRFTDIKKEIRSTPSSEWNEQLVGNIVGDYYAALAKTMKNVFVEFLPNGKMLDRSKFIRKGYMRINEGR